MLLAYIIVSLVQHPLHPSQFQILHQILIFSHITTFLKQYCGNTQDTKQILNLNLFSYALKSLISVHLKYTESFLDTQNYFLLYQELLLHKKSCLIIFYNLKKQFFYFVLNFYYVFLQKFYTESYQHLKKSSFFHLMLQQQTFYSGLYFQYVFFLAK